MFGREDVLTVCAAADVLEHRLGTDLAPFEEQFASVLCESALLGHEHEHAAHWWAQCPCDDFPTPVCESRRRRAREVDGWRCRVVLSNGCTAFHPYSHIRFTPVDL